MPQAKVKQSFLYRINKKYDQLKEPLRVLIMFVLVMPGIFSVTLPGVTIWSASSGMIWLLILLAVRFCYIEKIFIKKRL